MINFRRTKKKYFIKTLKNYINRNKILKSLKTKIKKLFIYPNKKRSNLSLFEGSLFNLKSTNFIEEEILKNPQEWESDLRLIFKNTISKGSIVLDIGANIGAHSLLFSKLVGENGQVYAFEPIFYNLMKLNLNKHLNDAKNIEIINLAVSEFTGEVEIFEVVENEYHLGSSSLYKNEYLSTLNKKLLKNKIIKSISLDDFVESRNIKVDFIKMDIEGGELSALKGCKKLLNHKPKLLIEYNSDRIKYLGHSNLDFKNLLDNNYYCYEVLKKDDINLNDSLELFNFDRDLYGNLFCIPKHK